jgi:RNA polymerase sigma-70 factor (TIGR02960 family)
VTADLVARARAGDEEAFGRLVAPHRRELHVYCYRILGSTQEAEDALQETLVAAWQGLSGFEGRSSLRTWLYQVATNRCLNMLRSARRRPQSARLGIDMHVLPDPSGQGEVLWLEPYPDVLFDQLSDDAPDPQARYESRESISLAFVKAVQLLPARQRAVLILRDVLGFHAAEVASMLDSSEESVTSALKRARATLDRRLDGEADRDPPPPPGSDAERELVEAFTQAFVAADVDALVALLSDDVRLAMPPLPLEYDGRDLAASFLAAAFGARGGRTYRMVPTRANGQPAFGAYALDPGDSVYRSMGVLVLGLTGNQISGITRFENTVLPFFGLPRTLRD